MIRPPSGFSRPDTLCPMTALFRSPRRIEDPAPSAHREAYTGDGASPTNTGFCFAGQLGIHPLDAAACFQRSKLLLDSPQKIRLGDPEYGALLTIILGAGDRRHADDRHCHDEQIGRAHV